MCACWIHALDIFFFSSRRRHTRCGRDWSSDVCSSDLFVAGFFRGVGRPVFFGLAAAWHQKLLDMPVLASNTDRKSTRLNSSHVRISYAVFCLKKKKKENVQALLDLY